MKKALLIIIAIVMPFIGGNILCAQTFLYTLPNNTGYLAINNGVVIKYYRNAPSNIPNSELGENSTTHPDTRFVSLREKDTLCARQGHPIVSPDSLVNVVIPPMVTAPNGAVLHITTIDRWAFKHDPYVLSITIPNTVSRIRAQAIYACHNLKRIVIEERPDNYDGPNLSLLIHYWAVIYCDSLQYLHLPAHVDEVMNGSFFYSIPDTLSYNVKDLSVYISEYDFHGLSTNDREERSSEPFSYLWGDTNYCNFGQKWKQTKVIMGDSVERIAKDIFTVFFGGDTIIVGRNVREIEKIRSKYEYVILPDDLESLGVVQYHYTFSDQLALPDSLREVVIPDKVTSPIPPLLLVQRTMRKATIGKSITDIWADAITREIDTLIIRSRKIQNLSSDIFWGYYAPHAHIIVPCGKLDEYRSTSVGMYGDVTWEEDTNCHLRVDIHPNDSSYGTVSGEGYYYVNSQVTITATPNEGYRFVKWVDGEGNFISWQRQKTFQVVDDVDYTAVFQSTQDICEINTDNGIIFVLGRHVIIQNEAKEHITLMDITGRIISRTIEQNYTSPMLNQGVYLVKIGQQPARKVIVL